MTTGTPKAADRLMLAALVTLGLMLALVGGGVFLAGRRNPHGHGPPRARVYVAQPIRSDVR